MFLTDSNGMLELDLPCHADDDVVLEIGGEADEWATKKREVRGKYRDLPRVVTVKCIGRKRCVRGIVADSGGQGIGGAALRFNDQAPKLADQWGNFVVSGYEVGGMIHLHAEAVGYADEYVVFSGGVALERDGVTITLGVSRNVSGVVVDELNRPVVATVFLVGHGKRTSVKHDGSFSIDVREAREYYVVAEADGYIATKVVYTGQRDLRCVMRLGDCIEGVVVDESGDGIAGASVYVAQKVGDAMPRSVGVTDAAGRFRVSGIGTKVVYVTAGVSGALAETVPIRMPQMAPIRLTCSRPRLARVKVVVKRRDNKKFVWNALVSPRYERQNGYVGGYGTTDEEGVAECWVPTDRSVILEVRAADDNYMPARVQVASLETVQVDLDFAGVATGRALGLGSVPLNDFCVQWQGEDVAPGSEFGLKRRFIGTEGVWEMRGMPIAPGGRVKLEVSAQGYKSEVVECVLTLPDAANPVDTVLRAIR